MSKKFEVNQTLYLVPRGFGGRKPSKVTITKVGRKWLELSNFQRCTFDLKVDSQCGVPPGCYLSRAAYEEEVALFKAWIGLKGVLSSPIPNGMTIEKIRQARVAMGL